MKLHKINHDYKTTLWCGIAALATITGRPTSECRAAIHHVRGQAYGEAAVKGIYCHEITRALNAFGYTATRIQLSGRPTLAGFLRTRTPEQRAGICLLNTTGHYVTVSGRKFIDNQQSEAVNLADAHCRRARVRNAWIIGRIVNPVEVKLPQAAPRVDKNRAYRDEIARLVRACPTIKVDTRDLRELGHIWVTDERWDDDERDPHHGDHIAYDWQDALARVRVYHDCTGKDEGGAHKPKRHTDGCTVVRTFRRTHGTLNLRTGETTETHSEWVTEPCRVPLFSDREQSSGVCNACADGWEGTDNYFAGPLAVLHATHAYYPGACIGHPLECCCATCADARYAYKKVRGEL